MPMKATWASAICPVQPMITTRPTPAVANTTMRVARKSR